MQIPSTKTEHRAVNALEAVIDEHSTMEHQINGNDKEMSWDGYIWLYKENNGDQSKLNFDARVPVQIKGHNDSEHKYIGKERISYSVELVDLEAYATEKGVLYFQFFVDGKNSEIFYVSLYPSKIADYLDAAKEKGNTATYSSIDTDEIHISFGKHVLLGNRQQAKTCFDKFTLEDRERYERFPIYELYKRI